MGKRRTNNEHIFVNPRVYIELLNDTRKEVGEEVLTSSKFKVLREAWVAGMFAATVSYYDGTIWYLRPNPEDVAPDFFAFHITEIDNRGLGTSELGNFEIFEWENHSKVSLYEAIVNKLKKIGFNAPLTTFVCYVTRPDEEINFIELAIKLKQLKLNILELCVIVKLKQFDQYVLVRLHPPISILPVPNSLPDRFFEYEFIEKGFGHRPQKNQTVKIDDQMQITIIED